MPSPTPSLTHCARISVRHSPSSISLSRSFSQTTARRKHGQYLPLPSHHAILRQSNLGSLPTFPPTSSQELDSLLSTLRTNIFLPSHLIKPHRALIYRKTLHHHLLGEDPVSITLAGEKHTLKPLDHLTDEPNSKKAFHQALGLMKEKRDYGVLPGLLEGYQGSGRVLTKGMAEKMIRKVAEAGSGGIVTECLRRVHRTGLKLDNVTVAREAMWVAIQQAIQGSWSEKGLEKALKYAEGILEFLEDPRHVHRKHLFAPANDPRLMPDIIGVPLLLSATLLAKFPSNTPNDLQTQILKNKSNQHATRLLHLWPNANLNVDSVSRQDANYKLLMWVPVWHGLRTANRLAEKSEAVRRLTGVPLQQVGQMVERARDIVMVNSEEGQERRGLKLYSDLAAAL